jgi:hypothetical protein
MNTVLLAWLVVLVLAVAFAGVQFARWQADRRDARQAWSRLRRLSSTLPERFDASLVDGLAEPARRFFLFAIAPGTPLRGIVELEMEGELSLGTRQRPRYQPMHARQVLAAPHGMVWDVELGRGLMRASGSDGMVDAHSWTRFWLLRLLPLVRVGDTRDHLRSAFGRVVAEAVFWAPASMLPQAGVQWSAVDAQTARALVRWRDMDQEVTLRVDERGQPLWVSMPRWSNANAEGVFRSQPFGGEVSAFRTVEGFTIPFDVDGGNFFGTPEYFPFYRARVRSASFH